MAVVKQSGRPVSAAITVSGGSLVTVTDIMNAKPIFDDELISHRAGNKQTPLYLLGDKVRGFEFTTTDVALLLTCTKGVHCTAAVLTLEGVKLASSGTFANSDADVTVTLTDCTQVNDNSPGSAPGGNPGEATYRFLICQDPSDQSEGTCTVAVA
jgi:hypothetical protein